MSRYATNSGISKISDLNKKITIQKLMGTIQNENGFEEEQWSDFITLWASKNNLFGREFWSAKAVQEEKTVEFRIRYGKWINMIDTKNYRIRHGKKTVDNLGADGEIIGTKEIDVIYNITFIDNVKYENTWVKIKTLEL